MRKLAGIFLISLYVVAMLKPVMPYIDYVLNYDYISTQLCENKAKPEMKCHGKCYLKKQIAKAAKESEHPTMPNFQKVTEDLYVPAVNKFPVNNTEFQTDSKWSRLESKLSDGFESGIWNPPQV